MAKLIGNFDMTSIGTSNDGMFIMNGGPSFFYKHTSKTAALIYTDIVNFLAAGHFIQSSVVTGGSGLVANHAYSVLGAYTLANGAKLV